MFFFFNDTATTEIYTLSLHDALPILLSVARSPGSAGTVMGTPVAPASARKRDRKSTRLNSSHSQISYAVFCLKKKKNNQQPNPNHNCSICHRSWTDSTPPLLRVSHCA